MVLQGSSPLARGLRSCSMSSSAGSGIIPARAGFTCRSRRRPSNSRDHPRSRGVYDHPVEGVHRARGSSPLARGLPVVRPLRPGQARIIPARAGFTAMAFQGRRGSGDHPRSRGVYDTPPCPRWDRTGSSPLARGLRPPGHDRPPRPGIIPARAGFTLDLGGRLAPGEDHPRSRGVYPEENCHEPDHHGSSPLARGLPARAQRYGYEPRIIPARAGFTLGCTRARRLRTDHPRSRGAYLQGHHGASEPPGSSPLARGLLYDRLPPEQTTRIIPARAGFTGIVVPRGGLISDHPRSRGVYA